MGNEETDLPSLKICAISLRLLSRSFFPNVNEVAIPFRINLHKLN